MMWYARIAALALAILTVLGIILWVDISDRYLAASEVRLGMWRNVDFAEVRIPRITSPDQVVTVGVLFRVTNPTRIGIELRTISYEFYMDNLTDPRSFFDKRSSILVGVGGSFASDGGTVVGPHTEQFVWANLTVRGAAQPETLARLNLTYYGKYYPIIDANVVYRVVGTTITDRVLGLVFETTTGVAPYES